MKYFEKYLSDSEKQVIQKMLNETELVGDHLVVKQISEEQTRGGLVIPDTASNEGMKRGLVCHVGPGIWQGGEYKQMQPKIGNIVWFDRGRLGNEQVIYEIEYDEHKFVVLPEAIVVMIEK